MSNLYYVYIPQINEDSLPVLVSAPSDESVRIFVGSILEGALYSPKETFDPSMIEYAGDQISHAEIITDECGIASSTLTDTATAQAYIMAYRAAARDCIGSLKAITDNLFKFDDGSYSLPYRGFDDGRALLFFAEESLNRIPTFDDNHTHLEFNGDVALLKRHPAFDALHQIITMANQDMHGTILFCPEATDEVQRATAVASMDARDLIYECTQALLHDVGLSEAFGKTSYREVVHALIDIDENSDIPADVAILCREAFSKAREYWDLSFDYESANTRTMIDKSSVNASKVRAVIEMIQRNDAFCIDGSPLSPLLDQYDNYNEDWESEGPDATVFVFSHVNAYGNHYKYELTAQQLSDACYQTPTDKHLSIPYHGEVLKFEVYKLTADRVTSLDTDDPLQAPDQLNSPAMG